MSAHHRQDATDLVVGGPLLMGASKVLPEHTATDAVINLTTPARPTGGYQRFVKPLIDMVGALALLVVLSPILLTVAIGVRATLGKGVFYRQVRVGRDGHNFTMLKFRSMIHDRRVRIEPEVDTLINEDRRRTHKHPTDPRVTSFGAFIRRYSLDELPQLFNVLRGDLSLVGPRPELVEIVDRYDTWQHRRHAVKPGLTGLWQVTERDREGLMHLCVETDLEYIQNLSLVNDLRILAMTIPAVLGGDPGDPVRETA